MNKLIVIILIFTFCFIEASTNNSKNKYANEEHPTIEDRLERGNWHNFKEFILVSCLARAYSDDSPAARDELSSSFGNHIEWVYYDPGSDFILKKIVILLLKP